MQFSTKEDIEAPIDFVFSRVTDFTGFERSALRRGADVKRLDNLSKPGIGSGWEVSFSYRGKPRTVEAKVTAFDAPDGFTITALSGGIDGVCTVDLVALSRQRTRLTINVTLSAHTMAARLLLQTLKVARGSITKKFNQRVTDFAEQSEDRYRRSV